MKTTQTVVTSGNSPLTIPLNPRGGPTAIGATPAGAGDYTVTFVIAPIQEGATLNPFAITSMTAATTAQNEELGPVSAVIVTLNSGTSVTIDLAQSDV
jgi:hypothetical protein